MVGRPRAMMPIVCPMPAHMAIVPRGFTGSRPSVVTANLRNGFARTSLPIRRSIGRENQKHEAER